MEASGRELKEAPKFKFRPWLRADTVTRRRSYQYRARLEREGRARSGSGEGRGEGWRDENRNEKKNWEGEVRGK